MDAQPSIDLFVVRPTAVSDEDAQWRAQIDHLARQIERWTGNQASIAEASEEEMDRLGKEDRPIVDQLRSDAIVVEGAEIPALLGTHNGARKYTHAAVF